jgi:molybdopterin-guanine dinucleotide biosynthesis protein B
MSSIVSFIGWHDSGKTTLASKVVTELKKLGYRVAVIKSSNDSGIVFDTPGTDTYKHKEAGADAVMLVAPDQMVLQTHNYDLSLRTLAHRYFPDVDIVVAEGFKRARKIPKIEVFRNEDQKLRQEVHGVIAVATDIEGIAEDYVFKLDEAYEIALFIEKRFLTSKGSQEITALLVNGNKIPIKEYIQESLAGTVYGFVKTLKLNQEIKEIELRFKVDENSEK